MGKFTIRVRYIIIASLIGVVPIIFYLNIPAGRFFTLLGLGVVAMIVATISESKIVCIYFAYIPFEGFLKIHSNFHPVIHVSSDLLLILILVRLMARKVREPEIGPGKATRENLNKVLPLLIIYWIWVGLQFLNPWGIGLIPSLASLKIHAMPYLLFFFIGYLMRPEEIVLLPRVVIIAGIVSATVAAIDGILGPEYLPSLHPRYQQIMSIQFQGALYRPFGTTQVIGGPAAWTVLSSVAGLFVLSQLRTRIPNTPQPSSLYRLWVGLFLAIGLVVILLCQVRVSFLQFGAIAFLGTVLGGKKAMKAGLIQLAIVILAIVSFFQFGDQIAFGNLSADRIQQITDRFLTLGEARTFREARGGALDAGMVLSKQTILGIGLSRVGAASGVFQEQMKKEKIFGNTWTFADNAYLALFVETGIGGLVAWVLLYLMVFKVLVEMNTTGSRIVAAWVIMHFASGLGSEGILYVPPAAYLWLYVSYVIRLESEKGAPV